MIALRQDTEAIQQEALSAEQKLFSLREKLVPTGGYQYYLEQRTLQPKR